MNINNWRSPLVRLIILNMAVSVAMCSQHELTRLLGIIGKPQLPSHPAPPSPGTRVMIRSGTGHYFAGKTGTVVSDHPRGGQMIRLDDTRTETRVASRFIERLPEGSPTCEDAEEKPLASEAEDSVASDAEEKAAEPASPTASVSSPRISLREDPGEMTVTAYMHKSLTSKLSLTSRSTLTKWAIDGATKPKTWWGKMLGATGGFLASVVAAPVTAISAVGGYLRNKSEAKKQQEKITFYWRGNDLWCRFPQSTCVRNIKQAHKPQVHDPRDLYQETKVARIHGIFSDEKIVIRFAKTRGYQTASDRVIDIGSAYTNLKKTLLWIKDNQGHRDYFDRSINLRIATYLRQTSDLEDGAGMFWLRLNKL
jgi:hypothetical protein